MFLFDDNKLKMARKPEKILKKNPVGSTGEGEDEKEIGEGYRKIKQEPPVFQFRGEVTLVRLVLTSVRSGFLDIQVLQNRVLTISVLFLDKSVLFSDQPL